MNNKDIRVRLSRAVADATPNVLDEILLGCEQQEGVNQGIPAQTAEIEQPDNFRASHGRATVRSRKSWARAAAVIAAVLIVAGLTPLLHLRYSVDSVICLDVNPSIAIKINRNEKVLSVTALNNDALVVIDGMNLKNVDLNVAVNALIGSMLKHGYVDEIKNSILVTVENKNTQKVTQIQEQLTDEIISTLLNVNSINGAVISQTVTEDERLRSLANEHGISIGKAALVDFLVQQDERLKFGDISKLSINDISLLIVSRGMEPQGVRITGQASSDAYIGEENAKSAAYIHAGITVDAVSFSNVKLDYDDGRMVYKIDFRTVDAEYEYKIDAMNGNVISSDKNTQRNDSQQHQQASTPSGTRIGEPAAKSIVLTRASLDEADAAFVKVQLARNDGRDVYAIEFYSGNIGYRYEVDAITGEILEYDRDIEDHFTSGGTENPAPAASVPVQTPQTTPPTTAPMSEGIDEARAKLIALTHAGISESDVSDMSVKTGKDDGRPVYKVEFRKGKIEYSYEIETSTGNILEWESD